MPQKKGRKKGKFKKGKRGGVVSGSAYSRPRMLTWRGPTFMPPVFRTGLRYAKELNMVNALSGWANVRFIPTYAYDVDPIAGSTAMPGFTELQTIYRAYRVLGSRIKVEFSNLDTLAGTVVVCPVNYDPGANTVSFQTYLSSFSTKSAPIGFSTGNGQARVSHSFRTSQFGGALSNAVDTYSTSLTAAPANNIFWLVGSYLNTNQINGVFIHVIIDIDIEFFELLSPAV